MTASLIASAIATGSLAPATAGVQQHAVDTELHGDRRVRGGADTGVHDDRDTRELEDDLDVVEILDAEPGSDRRAEGHDRGGAGVLQLATDDRIVVRVGQHHEPVLDQYASCLEQAFVVREERALVTDDLELDPLGQPHFPRQTGGADGVLGGVAPRRVGQQQVFGRSMKSSNDALLRSVTLTRRTATVTSSAPDASCACRITSFDVYLPVPMINREAKVLPAITKDHCP